MNLIAEVFTTEEGTHYGDPFTGCLADEIAIRVSGISGGICAPKCGHMGTSCPQDVPPATTARPQCALQSPTGSKYCTLICSKADTCPENAECQIVQAGIGICTYSN